MRPAVSGVVANDAACAARAARTSSGVSPAGSGALQRGHALCACALQLCRHLLWNLCPHSSVTIVPRDGLLVVSAKASPSSIDVSSCCARAALFAKGERQHAHTSSVDAPHPTHMKSSALLFRDPPPELTLAFVFAVYSGGLCCA